MLALLGEQVESLLNDSELGTVERARTICYLAGTLPKAIELGNLAARLESLEAALNVRSKN